MTVKQIWSSPPQFVDANGDPYSGALLFFYAAGSSTKQNVYTDSGGGTAASNPTTLNSSGYPAASGNIFTPFGTVGQTYKIGLAAPGSADPPASFIWTEDDIAPTNDVTVSVDEWVTGAAPTYISATSFSLVGDQTSTYHVGRRVKTTNSGGTVYSTILTSAYGAVTTITVVNDSGTLDSGLSAVYYGLLSATNPSTPLLADTYPIVSGSADKTKKLRIEVDGFTTATTRVLTPPDANLTLPDAATLGTVPMVTATGVLGMRAAMNKAIYGLTYDVGTDTTNDININTGGAMDATGAWWMTLATALGKQSDVNWAVGGTTGTPAGWLDTGAVGNNDYYIWLIARSDTGVVDSLCSLSSTAPTMPANYDYKRLIGWFKRVGGTIVAFHTYEFDGGALEMTWDVPTLDINLANTLTTARRTDALKVPLNLSTVAKIYIMTNDVAAFDLTVVCPDQTDAAPSPTAAPGSFLQNDSGQSVAKAWMIVRTSAAGLIASRIAGGTLDLYAVVTHAFTWGRRN